MPHRNTLFIPVVCLRIALYSWLSLRPPSYIYPLKCIHRDSLEFADRVSNNHYVKTSSYNSSPLYRTGKYEFYYIIALSTPGLEPGTTV